MCDGISGSTPAVANDVTLNAAGEYQALVFQAMEDMVISHIFHAWRSATGSPTLDLRIETVGTDGIPTGTLWGTNTNIVTGTLAGSGSEVIALTAAAMISKGDIFAVKRVYNSGTSIITAVLTSSRRDYNANIPYTVTNVSGSPSKQPSTVDRLLGLGSSSTAFYNVATIIPVTTFTSVPFNNTNGARQGARFKVPFKCRAAGVRWWNSSVAGDFNVALYNDAGTQLAISTSAFEGDRSGLNTGAVMTAIFGTPAELTSNTWYRMVVTPNSATNVAVAYVTLSAASMMSAMPGGANFHYITYASSAWDDTNTDDYPLMDLIYDQLDDGTGGGDTNIRGNTSLNVAYVHATSGKAVGLRYMARTANPIDELYVFLDASIGTIGSITMEAKIYNEGSTAGKPGSTLRDTSTATVVPSAVDKWIKFTFGTPYTPVVGEILWFVVYNTSGAPGTDAPAILTSTNMTVSGPDAGYTTSDGFTTDGAVAEVPHVVKQGADYIGQPFTQRSTPWASNSRQRGVVITPTVNVDISGVLFDAIVALNEFKVYADATAPGGTALLTADLDGVANLITADISGARIFATSLTLDANTTYKGVLTYTSSDATTPAVYEIEDYASYTAVFDALRATDPFFNPWMAIDDGAGGWTILKNYAPAGLALILQSFEAAPPGSTNIIVIEDDE